MITQWGYEEGLIQSYTLPYLKIIHTISPEVSIFLVTQEKTQLYKDGPKLKRIEEYLSGYNIILLPEKYYKAGFVKYLFSVSRLFKHLGFIFKNKIGIIHSFCTPAGSYAYILAKLTNRQLIVDSYEPHSEYMRESGAWSEKSFKYRFLTSMEKKQAVAARHLIATTPGMLAYTKKRFNIQLKNEYVKPACVDLEKFNYKEKEAVSIRKQMGLEKKIVGVYAGKFGDFYLKDEIFDL
ncbi:MAG TPA: hypothetical protein VET23_12915, partial [Chitinophagaceae bacterium]|nr:hypothetical protein [Chitinophagaceae bacterium]